MKWSRFQQDIFDFNINGTGSSFIDAKAGSGKSTVIKKCVEDLPSQSTVLVAAFNKHIEVPMAEHFEAFPNVTVKTFHGLGLGLLRSRLGFCRLNDRKVYNLLRYDILNNDYNAFQRHHRAIRKIIALAKAHGTVEMGPRELRVILDNHEILFDGDTDFLLKTVNQTLATNNKKTQTVDFDDMVYLPVVHNLVTPDYDYVFVDEAQDLSPVQIELIQRSIAGRGMFVGDRHQAIYRFRGADDHAITKLIAGSSAVELPLSISYRCSKAVVKEAQYFVPEIQAHADAPEGSVTRVGTGDFHQRVRAGDLVLCRTKLPLVSHCFNLLKRGIKACIRGRDICEELLGTLERMAELSGDFKIAARLLTEELTDKIKHQGILDSMLENVEIVMYLHRNAPGKVEKSIRELFDERVVGITFSTIHKAKGLEADRVFLIRPDLIPHPKARSAADKKVERNLGYVAVTRAKTDFAYVSDSPKDDPKSHLSFDDRWAGADCDFDGPEDNASPLDSLLHPQT